MLAASNATRGIYQAAGLTTRKLDGDAELRKIATAGREWMFTVGRKIDMESGWSSEVPDCDADGLGSLRLQAVPRMGKVVGGKPDGDELWLSSLRIFTVHGLHIASS